MLGSFRRVQSTLPRTLQQTISPSRNFSKSSAWSALSFSKIFSKINPDNQLFINKELSGRSLPWKTSTFSALNEALRSRALFFGGDNKESHKDEKQGQKGGAPNEGEKQPFNWTPIAVSGAVLLFLQLVGTPERGIQISFQDFRRMFLLDPESTKAVNRLEVINGTVVRVFLNDEVIANRTDLPKMADGSSIADALYFTIGSTDTLDWQLEVTERAIQAKPIEVLYKTKGKWTEAFFDAAPFLLIIGFLLYGARKMARGGGDPFKMGKINARSVNAENRPTVSFKDVAGMAEAKQEIMEFVSFLKKPEKFQELGAKIPRGAILMGSPGTGKTLLAKAVAGEAGVPFFTVSGSDFVEMFVGVGPSRVRDLFKQARENTPCIVYIDEIDAIGKKRGGGGLIGGNDERENTLNQLLVEMDGFKTSTEVVVLASTNMTVEQLDKALLRPGRFDRQITIEKPDVNERQQIFMVHLSKITLDPSESIESTAMALAERTPGFAGADIANVCNEGALIAARGGKDHVSLTDFDKAIDRVIGGLEKKNSLLTAEEKKIVAYHEAGHAITGWFLKHTDPLVKISIIPRGQALGFAQYLPKEDKIKTQDQLLDMMCMTLGGRVAELIQFGHLSTGAADDLQKVTSLAYTQITRLGMGSAVGHLSYEPNGLNMRPYSDETAKNIDQEVRALIDGCFERTKDLLLSKREALEQVALHLFEKEVVSVQEFEKIVGPRPTI